MTASRRHGRLAIAAPVAAGAGLLGIGVWLLPGQLEVRHAERRAHPEVAPVAASDPAPVVEAAPAPPPLPPLPELDAAIGRDGAATLAALTDRLTAAGAKVTTAQVAYDLVARRRPAVALAYLAARPDGATPATFRLRADLLRETGRTAEATALLVAAARKGSGVAAADIVATAYALDRADLIVAAAASGAIPPPDATLALDLARRAERSGRFDEIAVLDRATRADWRAGDPWLAIRLAQRSGDTSAALRAAALLPATQREAAREAIVTRAGDRDALRRMLLARGGPVEPIAEQLLAAGYRDDAVAVLKRGAATQTADSRVAQRLLYLLGPRPAAEDRAWLRDRAMRGDRGWLRAYVDRESPRTALAFLGQLPAAGSTDMLLMRLALANAAGDDGAARTMMAALLDGRALDVAQMRQLSAATPRRIDAAMAARLARRRVEAGQATSRDRLDLAWAAFNAGDATSAGKWTRDYLADAPDDLDALRLMAEVQTKAGGAAAARPWWTRALAQAPAGSRARAEILDRLGRRAEAVALVGTLRRDAPDDRSLAALHARLLIADGRPGEARAVLTP